MTKFDLRVTRREWTMAVCIALGTTLLLLIPYILGYAFARPGTEYTGLVINVEDGSYLSAIGEGYNGAWLYQLPFTTEQHAPAFIEVFYLALGHLARALGLSIVQAWHLARVLASLFMFVTMFGFIAFFVESSAPRMVAYLFAIFGAGLDWWQLPWEQADALSGVPLDLRMPEAHPFFLAMTYPHIAVNLALVLLTFWLAVHAMNSSFTNRRRWSFALGAAATNFLLGIVYPFLIFLTAAALGVYFLYLMWRERKILWRDTLLLFSMYALPAPLFIYYEIELQANLVLQIWNAQAAILSPNPIHYLLAYIPFIALGAFAVKNIFQHGNSKQMFLLIWAASVALLLYAPVSQQRRFVQGLQIPLAIVATLGLFQVILPWFARNQFFKTASQRPGYSAAGLQRLAVAGLIALTAIANLYIYVGTSVMLGIVQPYPLFRPTSELQAMDWLGAHTSRTDAILSAYWTGSYIPYRAGNTVFVGQRYETAHFEEKWRASEKFFSADADDAWRRALLSRYGIAYVFAGRAERAQREFDPTQLSYLTLIFSNNEVTIYRVELQ